LGRYAAIISEQLTALRKLKRDDDAWIEIAGRHSEADGLMFRCRPQWPMPSLQDRQQVDRFRTVRTRWYGKAHKAVPAFVVGRSNALSTVSIRSLFLLPLIRRKCTFSTLLTGTPPTVTNTLAPVRTPSPHNLRVIEVVVSAVGSRA
jgi:hypothetical protein